MGPHRFDVLLSALGELETVGSRAMARAYVFEERREWQTEVGTRCIWDEYATGVWRGYGPFEEFG